ncbi:MAG: hypothetical protein Q4E57_01730 [Eubacteriales bacterium]|nr:hypothetical protein [Eubacteriales bacterium]
MDLGNILGVAKALDLTDDQKATAKKIVKEAAGNKDKIIAGLKEHGVNINENQVDLVMKLVDKL